MVAANQFLPIFFRHNPEYTEAFLKELEQEAKQKKNEDSGIFLQLEPHIV